MSSSEPKLAESRMEPSESISWEMSETDVRTRIPQSISDRDDIYSPCKNQGGGDSIASYMPSSSAADYASDESLENISDITDEEASGFLNECHTDSPTIADDMIEMRAKMVALYNRIESRMDQEAKNNPGQSSQIDKCALTTEKHVRFARSPGLITSPRVDSCSPNFFNGVAYSEAYENDFYEARDTEATRQEELGARLRELNDRVSSRMRAKTPTVLGNLLLNRSQTPYQPSRTVTDLSGPNEGTLSDSESDSSQWNTRYFYADDTQIKRQSPCVTRPTITIDKESHTEIINVEVKGTGERKETTSKSMHDVKLIEIKEEIRKGSSGKKKANERVLTACEVKSKSDSNAQITGGNIEHMRTTAKKSKSDFKSKSEKKKKSGKKKAKSTVPRLPTYPEGSYVPNTRLVLPPIGSGDNYVRSPCKTPESFLDKVEEYKKVKPKKRGRKSGKDSKKTTAHDKTKITHSTQISVGQNESTTAELDGKCNSAKGTKSSHAKVKLTQSTQIPGSQNQTITTKSDDESNSTKGITASHAKVKLAQNTHISGGQNKSITTKPDDKGNNTKGSPASHAKVNKTVTVSIDKVNKPTTTADTVNKTTTTADVTSLQSGLESDIAFLKKAISIINNNNKENGQPFVPLETTVLSDQTNPALNTFKTHDKRVHQFRANFSRETILLPPIGTNTTDNTIKRYPGQMELGSTMNHTIRKASADIIQEKQFHLDALAPIAPSGPKPHRQRRPVKVKMPSAKEQENINQMMQRANYLPMPPKTDNPKRSRTTVRVPCVDTDDDDDDDDEMNGFIKYF